MRIVLLFNEQTSELGFGFLQWVAVFGLGALNDLCALTLGYVFLWLFLLTLSKRKYDRPTGYVLLGVLTAAFCYVAFCNTIFDEYGSAAPLVATIVLGLGRQLRPAALRAAAATAVVEGMAGRALLAIYVSAILFNAVSEYYFWNEFGVRYNFIAVDYLVYTNEVVGNIMESYPIVPLATLIVALTVAVTWWLFRRDIRAAEAFKTGRWKLVASPIYLAMAGVALWMLPFNTRFQTSDNVYYNELQANGLYKFYEAFLKNELDYMHILPHAARSRAAALVHDEYRSEGQNHRYITSAERGTTPQHRARNA